MALAAGSCAPRPAACRVGLLSKRVRLLVLRTPAALPPLLQVAQKRYGITKAAMLPPIMPCHRTILPMLVTAGRARPDQTSMGKLNLWSCSRGGGLAAAVMLHRRLSGRRSPGWGPISQPMHFLCSSVLATCPAARALRPRVMTNGQAESCSRFESQFPWPCRAPHPACCRPAAAVAEGEARGARPSDLGLKTWRPCLSPTSASRVSLRQVLLRFPCLGLFCELCMQLVDATLYPPLPGCKQMELGAVLTRGCRSFCQPLSQQYTRSAA